MKFKKIILLLVVVFSTLIFTSCNKKDDLSIDGVTLAAPNGAPAICVASLAKQNSDNYSFVEAETISTELASKTAPAVNADFVIAPINAGAKLFKAGKSKYKLAAVVTWGNIYFVSRKADFKLEDINNNEITMFGNGTSNAAVANYVLAQKNIVPSNVEYKATAALVQAEIVKEENINNIYLCAEPAITALKVAKKIDVVSYSVYDLYKELTNADGYAQAGLFVNPSAAEAKKDIVNKYIEEVEKSSQKCSTNLDDVAQICADLKILPNYAIAKQAIPSCKVRFVKALDAKADIEKTANLDLSTFGGSLPVEEFYYKF